MLLKTTVQLREVSIILLIVEGDKLGASVFRDVLIMMILISVMILSSAYIRFRILSLTPLQLLQQQLLLVIMIPSSVYINLTVQMENHGI